MVYRVIGLMSGSSLDGLDIVFAELNENAGKWSFEILNADCYPYPPEWSDRLQKATTLSALDYQLLHTAYGHYLGQQVNRFIDEYQLHYKVALIASHGHTTFHLPAQKMTAQLGDGASIAAETKLPVITDLRSLDVALGGQGAPIVPVGEKLLWADHGYFLNIGGIANLSFHAADHNYRAFDICPANRVLNMLAALENKPYDEGGNIAATGSRNEQLFEELNKLDYYQQPFPKSLANDFGTELVFPLIRNTGIKNADALRTMTEHIVYQLGYTIGTAGISTINKRMLVTGGGALNSFLVKLLREELAKEGIEIVVPDQLIVNYKEALVMALFGVLRWRQEYNVFASVTGASRDSIGGALWTGQEA
jgi:anhydro-N-acetylmuramic acid kinase